ncbi:UvrD-helicase domain-containing protein [Adlercreutzia sp. ZJ154]|uniref:HelD family protein n=1 Tax=Adlercreutzia sp. ZJ154 TaxID=2709790 RepID=UPI001F14C276|nr:UvrD-helicase domain-containing protein [Adlercreutzia sp. ZJ154]
MVIPDSNDAGINNTSNVGNVNSVNNVSDPVFSAEQAHLSEVYSDLLRMQDGLAHKISQIDFNAAADKDAMAEELTLNATSFDEALETYAAFATANSVIDSYNIASEAAVRKLRDVQLLLKQPYFAKIELQYGFAVASSAADNANAGVGADGVADGVRELYIGAAGVSDEDYKRLVVDWRSPVAEVYYNQQMGDTSYVANGRKINVNLKLRRQFDIERDCLRAYFDTSVAIEDPLLLRSLSDARTPHMKAITTTIQREQNTVIRHEDVPALLVSGVAGSGKTSVLLQRIAYLFYRHREDLRPDQVYLITPNSVFRTYIENVLPEMGESNPQAQTWDELAARLLPHDMKPGKGVCDIERLQTIERGIANLHLTQADFREIRSGKVRFISTNQIDGLMHKHSNVAMGPRRITLVREGILKRAEQRLRRMAASDDALDELDALSVEEQLRIFRETISPQTEAEARELALRMLRDKHAAALDAIENDEWLRIDRIGMRLLDASGVAPVEWLYTKMALCGLSQPDARYVMIDEVQDYSAAQLMVMAKYFRRAHFMLLGDENQSIGETATSFACVQHIFEQACGSCCRCDLMISYRSTPQITHVFAKLATLNNMQIESVHPNGSEPHIEEYASEEEYISALRQAVKQKADSDELTAIIVPWKAQLRLVQNLIGDSLLVVNARDSLPANGVFATTLKLAKGLEFDNVIIPDASAKTFPENDVSRRRLYTAISRATCNIDILSRGPISPWLSEKYMA